ncbi:hypothetical protein J4573_32135 [Actinomadura barringtoniae]|uniref:N,N-dimethylformamidase beta subunit-like C-terminal domain-containing protein n=1 Tax=Actinomadura barringtoniae TaxID=1427535 RepID=A0A939PFW3_9ACTN|nr:N,N-dimethylformamidase beta subunit family domain-containing protein [Actinomadura barringtoniae]MBO2451775.1 hypothetical protein [Actinomadura barringtoniae]
MRATRGKYGWIVVGVLLTVAGCQFSDGDKGHETGALKPPPPPASAGTAAENAKPGTPDWKLHRKGKPEEIEGYADRVSVLPGETFRLFVSTTTPGFSVEAFRMGWYGGAQARKVWSAPRQAGARQPEATFAPDTETVSAADWKPSMTVPTKDWPEGSYLLRLTADSGAQRYVPITVRSADTSGRLVILNATTTWQAYNLWGGRDLYQGPSGYSDRSRAVSFDRPYDKDGAGKFMAYEQPAIALAEKTGVKLAYATDNDLHGEPGLLDGATGLVTLGHDEYWSSAMRTRVTQARDRGLNIAFLGANAVNRHIRFGDTKLGKNRLVTCYKDAAEDPVARTDPAESTQDWRLDPKPRPESDLIGVMYNCFPAEGAYTVRRPDHWLFAGTKVKKGTSFPGMIGPESDALNIGGPTPRPLEVLAHSPIDCGGVPKTADSSYYTVKSGAGVFASGTMRWVCAMRGKLCGHGVTDAAKRFTQKVTDTLLRAMTAGPLGRAHPAKDEYGKISQSGF